MNQSHSTQSINPGQSPHRRPGARLISCLLLLGLGLGKTSCTSVYHRTRTQFPAEPAAELSLRVVEAGEAERLAKEAGQRLLNDLERRQPRGVTEIDWDRWEAAALELDRRVLVARDAAERCTQAAELTAEIERLSRQAQRWLEYVQTNRATDPPPQFQQLQDLLAP